MTASDANPLQDVWDLSMAMNDDLAAAHGTAEFEGRTIDDGWDQLPDRIAAASANAARLAQSSGHKHASRQARAIKETLGELYDSIVDRAAAQVSYLTIEASVKEAQGGEQPGYSPDLDRAVNRITTAVQTIHSSQSVLMNDIENLSADL